MTPAPTTRPEPTSLNSVGLSVVTASRGRHELLRRKALALARQTLAPRSFEWCLWLNEPRSEVETVRQMMAQLKLPFHVALAGGEPHPVGRARNLAAESARGDVLLLSDDDCMPDPGALAAHLALHRLTVGVAGIGPLRLPDDLRKARRAEPFERIIAFGNRASWINFTGANSSVSAVVYRQVGGYDPDWKGYGGEDPELALRLKRAGVRFRRVRQGGATHEGRVWDDSEKAYSAGRAHRRLWERHRTGAWALGVHPVQLAAKRVLLNGPWSSLIDRDVLAYERAYARGAEEAAREKSDG
ncbi:MAG TPA: glycosyltransferase [Trueperaceae bacterium]